MSLSPNCALLLGLLLAGRAHLAALTEQELNRYKSLTEGQGLYKSDDSTFVQVLTASNFRELVYGQPHANLVEFYNSWCGACQRFAPIWVSFANEVKNWRWKVRVSAIDCSVDENSPICRDFEIMGYPTLRYFSPRYHRVDNDLADAFPHAADVKTLAANLAQLLVPESHPFNTSNLFDNIQQAYVFVIADEVGAEVALELPHVTVKWFNVVGNSTTVKKGEVNAYVKGQPAGEAIKLEVAGEQPLTRKAAVDAIRRFLGEKSVDESERTTSTSQTRLVIDRPRQHRVYQADLDLALRQSLRGEVAQRKRIQTDDLQALRSYVTVLAKYYPTTPAGRVLLQRLSNRLNTVDALEGASLTKWLDETDDFDRLFTASNYRGCAGSTGKRRGYPCGLWTLFHYLTVAATSDANAQPLEVLTAVLGYVRSFFGCAECARHFVDLSETKQMSSVESADSAVLWLWMAHNSANRRLAGDVATEDPAFPKVQFPEARDCGACRSPDGSWRFEEVLAHLKRVYVLREEVAVTITGDVSSPLAFVCLVCVVWLAILICAFLKRLALRPRYIKKIYVHDLLGKV